MDLKLVPLEIPEGGIYTVDFSPRVKVTMASGTITMASVTCVIRIAK